MYRDRRVTAVIIAAGSGSRMQGNLPKQYSKIGGRPVLVWAVEVFEKNPSVDDIYIVAAGAWFETCRRMMEAAGFTKVRGLTEGGETRQESVYRGLKAIPEGDGLVLVHDAARPFVTDRLIQDVIEMTADKHAAIPAVPTKDTMKVVRGGVFTETPERATLYAVQTPQGFWKNALIHAHERAIQEGFHGTDDAVLIERIGGRVFLTQGDYANIKLTTDEDRILGEAILGSRREKSGGYRIGTGFDVHRLIAGRQLILGGVSIPCEKGLLGHSDADVLTHALMDAVLGAAGLGDIGQLFPDSAEQYRGISSLLLLQQVMERTVTAGYRVENVDLTVIAQAPKLAPFREQIRNRLAETMALDPGAVSVKATTSEGLGFTGRGEGIAAQASVLLIR